ncbi:RNA methyltransferase, TrmH family protein [Toxoplasma gondii VAND]|uniref:RNA methyltransferase, TrmH family protein n=1 Tax=Toxoplasma gondii VAND TaxID=933077 RepID=A0A086PXY3_TOXGO|nr:RNA methyltransferase, TrmH family protein [Toxoplasma gondii VAND]
MGPPFASLSSSASPLSSSVSPLSSSASPLSSCPAPFSTSLAALVRFCTDLSRLPLPGAAAHPLLSSFLLQLLSSPASACSQESTTPASASRVEARQALLVEISDLLTTNALFQLRLHSTTASLDAEAAFPVSQLTAKGTVEACFPSVNREKSREEAEKQSLSPDSAALNSSSYASPAPPAALALSPLPLSVVRLLLECVLLLDAPRSSPEADAASASLLALFPAAPLQSCRVLLLLLSSSPVSRASRREGKAAKKERRRERDNKKREQSGQSRRFAEGAEASEAAASLPRGTRERGKHDGTQSPPFWAEEDSLQDRTIATKLVCRILSCCLVSASPSACCRFCRPTKEEESREQFTGKASDLSRVFPPCECSLSKGSLWILDELARARHATKNAEDFQHGELGLARAEKREAAAVDDAESREGQSVYSRMQERMQGEAETDEKAPNLITNRELPRFADMSLTCEGAASLLEAWLVLLKEKGETTELSRMSLRLLPLLFELCTASTFQSVRKSIFSRVLPLVLGHGLSSSQASLFLLSLISTLLEGSPRLCIPASRSPSPLPQAYPAPLSGSLESPAASSTTSSEPSVLSPSTSCFVASDWVGAQRAGAPTVAALEPRDAACQFRGSSCPAGSRPAAVRLSVPEASRSKKKDDLAAREDAFDLALRFPDLFCFPAFTLSRRGRWLCVSANGEAKATGQAPAQGALHGRDERWRWLFEGLVDATPLNRKRARALLERLQATEQQSFLRALRATRRKAGRGESGRMVSGGDDAGANLRGEEELRAFAAELERCGVSPEAQETGWQAFVQLLEALEDFSQHLVKQQWSHMRRLCALTANVSLHLQLGRPRPEHELSSTPADAGSHAEVGSTGDSRKKPARGDTEATAFQVLSFDVFSPSFFALHALADIEDRSCEGDGNAEVEVEKPGDLVRPLSPLVVQPLWVETVLRRILSHDNALLTRSLLLVFISSCVEEIRLHPLLAHCMRSQSQTVGTPTGAAEPTGPAAMQGGDSSGDSLGDVVKEGGDRSGKELSSSNVWSSSFNLAARAAAAAESGKQSEGGGPPELLCVGWDFFLHSLLPSLAASNLYSRSSDSYMVEKTVQRFIKSRLIAEYLIRTWKLHARDSYDTRANPESIDARGTASRACSCGQSPSPWTAKGEASSPASQLAVPSPENAFSSLKHLPRLVCDSAAERSIGDFLAAMSACNLTYTPFRVWMHALNALPTAPPSGPSCSSTPGGSAGSSPVSLDSSGDPRAFRLGRGVSRERVSAFVCLLRQLLQHIPAVVRAPLFSRLLRFLSLHAQPSALAPVDLALLFADAGASLSLPCPSSPLETAGASTLSVGQKLLASVFPEPAAFRRALLTLVSLLVCDDASRFQESRGCSRGSREEATYAESERKPECACEFPREILCEKVALGCLRLSEIGQGLPSGYHVHQEIAALLFSSPALLRVYSRPALPSLCVRSKLAALAAFLRLHCTSVLSSASSDPSQADAETFGVAPDLAPVASEVVAYVVCHLTTLARATEMENRDTEEGEKTREENPFTMHALCVNLPVYASVVNALSRLVAAGCLRGTVNALVARCEEILLAWSVDSAVQTSPRHLLLVSAALTLLSAAAPALFSSACPSVSPGESEASTQTEENAQRAASLFLLVFLSKVNRHLAVQRGLAAPVFFATEDSEKGDLPLLATIAAPQGGAPAPALPLAPSEGVAGCSAFSSEALFAFSEVGEFSTWPGIIGSFHRARAMLLDSLASLSFSSSPSGSSLSASTSLLGRFLHAAFSGSGLAVPPLRAFPPDSLSRQVSSAFSSLSTEKAAAPSFPGVDLSLLSPRLRTSLDAHMARATREADCMRLGSPILSGPRSIALSLLAEIDGCPSAALPFLFGVIRRFALPVLLLPHHLEARTETRTSPERGETDEASDTKVEALRCLHDVLEEFTEQTKRVILDRAETGLPLQAVREACAAVLSPLMLATESLCLREERKKGEYESASSETERGAADEKEVWEAYREKAFVLSFAKDLLGIGRNTISVSRASVVPLLSSLALLGLHSATGRSQTSVETQREKASVSVAGFFPLPTPYIDLLAEILLHREFVLLDGASVMTVDPFGSAYPWGGARSTDESVVDFSTPLAVLTSSDPTTLFFSPTSAAASVSPAFQPLALPPQLRRLRQTPAFIRLLALSFFHFLGQTVCSDVEPTGVTTSPRSHPFAPSACAAFRVFAADLLFRVSSRLLDIVTRAPAFASLATEERGEDGSERTKGLPVYSKNETVQGHYLPMPNSCHHRILLRGWQALSSLAPYFRAAPFAFLCQLHKLLWKAVAAPQLADVRHYIDLLAVQMLLFAPAQSCPPLVAILQTFNSPTQTLIGALTIAGFFLLHPESRGMEAETQQRGHPQDREEEHRVKQGLFAAIVPYLTSNAAYPRGVSQYIVYEFLRKHLKPQTTDRGTLDRDESSLGIEKTDHSSAAVTAPREGRLGSDEPTEGSCEAGRRPPQGIGREEQRTATQYLSPALGKDILHGLYRQLDESKECQKMREKCSEVFQLWQPHILGSLDTLLAVGRDGDADALDDTVNEATAAALAGVPVPALPCVSASAPTLSGLPDQDHGREASATAVAQTLLADFDLRPSWALAVALKDAIKEEMGAAWHGKSREKEPKEMATLVTPAENGVEAGRTATATAKKERGGEADKARMQKRDSFEKKETEGEKQDLVCQRKFVPQQHQRSDEEKGSQELLSSWLFVGGEGETLQRELRQRGDLVVVASLIDKVPNLAGLARTCEVFDAKKLVIHNLDILSDPQFNTIGVSAHRWLPIEQVSADDVARYLLDLKTQGYTVVGVEQTGSSQMLENARFDRKTALVLGAEKEGLPAALLALMDACIEIPQLGLIRSLNVHVTAAMVVWEYTKQHSLGA